MIGKTDFTHWRWHLQQGHPIITLVVIDTVFVRKGFRSDDMEQEFVWDYDERVGGQSVGHCVLITGYDSADSTFTLFNSFGQNWGSDGYAKVTEMKLKASCYGAYVYVDDDPPPIVPALEKDSLPERFRGDNFDSKMKLHTTHVFDGTEVSLQHIDYGEDHAVLHLQDEATGARGRFVHLEHGDERHFAHAGERWTVSYSEVKGLKRLFHKNVPVTIEKSDIDEDPFIQDYLKQLERVRKKIESQVKRE
jgi:hypothetical protein